MPRMPMMQKQSTIEDFTAFLQKTEKEFQTSPPKGN